MAPMETQQLWPGQPAFTSFLPLGSEPGEHEEPRQAGQGEQWGRPSPGLCREPRAKRTCLLPALEQPRGRLQLGCWCEPWRCGHPKERWWELGYGALGCGGGPNALGWEHSLRSSGSWSSVSARPSIPLLCQHQRGFLRCSQPPRA